MTEVPDNDGRHARAFRIKELCARFEAAWQGDERPQIEAYLSAVLSAERPALLGELLIIEIVWRRRRQEDPQLAEYFDRFPAYEAVVRTVFAAGTFDQRAGPAAALPAGNLRIHCPHCHTVIGIAHDASLEEITCPSCGSSFGLVGDEALMRQTTGGGG